MSPTAPLRHSLRVLCVADEVDLLVYSAGIRERFADTELVLSAGDLPDEYLTFITSMLNKPIISVAGNHDRETGSGRNGDPFSRLDMEGRDGSQATGRLAFKIRREAGLSILGIPGSMRYNPGPNQFSELSMSVRLLSLIPGLFLRRLLSGRGVDIILAHSPPLGIHDGTDLPHRGFKSFHWLIRAARPLYFLHGHVHLYDLQALREEKVGSTRILNVYGHRVIELEAGRE